MHPISMNFEGHEIRCGFSESDPHHDIWFSADDVCKALKLGKTLAALRPLDGDDKDVIRFGDGQGAETLIVVSQWGLNDLIRHRRSAVVQRFTRWLCHDVLPLAARTTSTIVIALRANDECNAADIAFRRGCRT